MDGEKIKDKTAEELKKYADESAKMYAGFHAPLFYKGREYWIDEKKIVLFLGREGVKRMPIFL